MTSCPGAANCEHGCADEHACELQRRANVELVERIRSQGYELPPDGVPREIHLEEEPATTVCGHCGVKIVWLTGRSGRPGNWCHVKGDVSYVVCSPGQGHLAEPEEPGFMQGHPYSATQALALAMVNTGLREDGAILRAEQMQVQLLTMGYELQPIRLVK